MAATKTKQPKAPKSAAPFIPASSVGCISYPAALLHKALTSPPKDSLKAEIIDPGQHILHGVAKVQIDVTISKGESGTARPRYAPDWPRVLAALTRDLDCDEAAKVITKALEYAHAERQLPAGHQEHVNQATETFIQARTDEGPEKPKSGATHVAGEVKILDWEPA